MKNKKKIYGFVAIFVILALSFVPFLVQCSNANEWSIKDIVQNEKGIFLPQMPAKEIAKIFDKIGYDLDEISKKRQKVPRIFVTQMPKDMASITDVNQKKDLFFKMMLPHVLRANEKVLKQREKLENISQKLEKKQKLSQKEKKFVYEKSKKYEVSSKQDDEMQNLKMRVEKLKAKLDAVSPSLTIVQSAIESAWGTSRFAKQGNALFGEWTWDGTGMVPKGRAKGEKHSVKRFSSIYKSVESYVKNTNRNKAYEMMWVMRAERRKAKKPYEGDAFASSMLHYSQRGMGYVNTIRSIIRTNNLYGLDSAELGKAEFKNFETLIAKK